MNDANTNPAAVQLVGLEKTYLLKGGKSVTALKDFNLEIAPGEIFGLLGPNGAGKTTLIGILTGVVRRTGGEARIFGRDVATDYLFTRSVTGVVPQETISDGFFTVMDIMRFQCGFQNVDADPGRIQEILRRLDLWDKRDVTVEQLSGGMKRRLLVAKALVHEPRFFILDEPTAGVDVYLRVHLWEYVREINARGTTILLTTHYLEEAERLCHRVGIMHHGRLLVVDTVPALCVRYGCRSLEDVFLALTGEEAVDGPPSL